MEQKPKDSRRYITPSGAGFASHPSYCSSTSYADQAACSGAKPAYCNNPNYANTKACSGPSKPSTGLVVETARRIGTPIDVRQLMAELMR
jgi:hypothetical protein